MRKKIDILIPVYNEAKSIAELVKRLDDTLTKAGVSYRAIFIDDRSTDRSRQVIKLLARKYPIKLLLKKGKKGKAYSILEGARSSRASILAMLDGDLQYPPEALPEMLNKLGEHGVVVANRKSHNTNLLRKAGSKANVFVFGKALLGLNCDTQSGLKVFRREVIQELSEEDVTPWTLDMPLLWEAKELGLTIGTVDIDFAERKNGHSNVNFVKTSIEIAKGALSLRFKKAKVYKIPPINKKTMAGSGVIHRKKKYITHTSLPHDKSALTTFTAGQKRFLGFIVLVIFIAGFINLKLTAIAIVGILTFVYFLDMLFGLYVLIRSLSSPPELSFSLRKMKTLSDSKLPIYTILCPLYKEARVLKDFVNNMQALEWPKNKLDVLLLLEENDDETIKAAKELRLPKNFRIIIVPHSLPKTKPKACNYGLHYAKGEYVVIFDAEDRPDPLQLKKAYLGFISGGKTIFCLQSKLNYFNPNYNILTRLFTAEYSLWFDLVLPGLQSINTAIPLGGTSNHFRTKELIKLHAWDPFNVTEDCDLGIRLFKEGYKTAIIDSTTYEEANSNLRNWIRQRSRWIKGYLQTYLVHMREPISFFRTHGIHAFIFQLVIGMRISFMVINPILWIATISYFTLYQYVGPAIESVYPSLIFYMAAASLVIGNFTYIYNYMIGSAKRGEWNLVKFVFLIPFYWIATSIAAIIAFYQLIVKPHYWEKTHHGLHLGKVVKQRETAPRRQIPINLIPSFSIKISKVPVIRPQLFAGVLLVIASLSANFLNFITSAYLGRSLGIEEFGLISLMGSFFFISQLPSTGFSETVSHQTAYLSGKYNRPPGEIWSNIFTKSVAISFVLSVIWLLLVPLLSQFFNSDTLIPFIVFAPMWLTLIAGGVNWGYLEGGLKFHWLAAITVIEAVVKLTFSIVLVQLNLQEWVYIALPVSSFVSLGLGWLVARQVASKNKIINVQMKIEKTNFSFPKKFFVTSILTKASFISFLSLDLVFVKHYLSPVDAGYYALLILVGRIIYMVGSLFSQFIIPLSSKEEGEGANNKSVQLLLFVVFISTFLSFITLGPLGKSVVPLLFGPNTIHILEHLTPYTLAIVLFTLASSLTKYHLAKKRYVFTIPGILTAVAQAVGLFLFHQTIVDVVIVIAVSSTFFIVSALWFHINFERLNNFTSNFSDFIGLFVFRLNGKHPLVGGNLRVLILNWKDIKHEWAGGAEVYVHEMAKGLVAKGHKVTIFCGNDGKSKRHENIDGVDVIRRGGFYTVYLWSFLYYLFHFRKRFDMIIESENVVPFFTPLYSNKPKILVIHHVHRDVFGEQLKFPISTLAQFVESTLMPFVYKGQQIVAVSGSTKFDLIKQNIAKEENIQIVSPGIDTNYFSSQPKTPFPSFIYIGRHRAYKNIEVAVNAFSKVLSNFPEAKLYIAGKGETTNNLKNLVNMLGIQHSVIFTGKVSEEEKITLLGQSWAAIQPSSYEGWGITVLEANACGTPVIASDVKGLRDSVVNGKTGFLVECKNVDLFVASMKIIIEDQALRHEFSKASVEWAKKFSWSKQVEELDIVLDETMKQRNQLYTRSSAYYERQ